MKCGAALRQPCPGRCEHCMLGKSHSGMTTNGVNCPEGVGPLAARMVDWVTIKTVLDSTISLSKSKEGVATKDRPLGSGVPLFSRCTNSGTHGTKRELDLFC